MSISEDKWDGRMTIIERILTGDNPKYIENLIKLMERFKLKIKDYTG